MIPEIVPMTFNEFRKKKFASRMLVDPRIDIHKAEGVLGFIRADLEATLEEYLYEQTVAVRKITKIFPRPTFLEWLFRKPRTVAFSLNVFDALVEPQPHGFETIRMAELKEMSPADFVDWAKK